MKIVVINQTSFYVDVAQAKAAVVDLRIQLATEVDLLFFNYRNRLPRCSIFCVT